jgi:Tfp pilus assembly protein PilX
MSDSTATTSLPASPAPAPPAPSSRRRHPFDRWLLVGGLALVAAAIVLLVLGVLALSSASSARDDSARFARQRRAADVRETAAQGDITSVVDEGNRVVDQIDKETDAANQVTQKNDELELVLENATDQFNAGNESNANATVDNQGRQLLGEEQGLRVQENQALTEARDAQDKLRRALVG